ncbi:A disintegrin and metalloproteinase with thrombospondin motifs adt-2-like isoform X2 [Cloeon dipterum]|uniref:A disintegrin and metalloproteinase with thrombospondin motifs adt-2-like isoform X2 n=1 Tax=Cloeon dipterum TaxID=197152 RepID=UPI0032203413
MRPAALCCGLAAFLCLFDAVHARRAHKFEVTEQNLKRLLTTHEWKNLFGPEEELFRRDEPEFLKRVSVVWPKESWRRRRRRRVHERINESAGETDENAAYTPARSVRLVFTNRTEAPLLLSLEHLPPSSNVVDDGLLVLSRYANSTSQLPDWTVRREEECLFRGDANQVVDGASKKHGQAAVSLCGGVIRGLIVRDHEYQVISPLPNRLTRRAPTRRAVALADTPHILIRGQAPPAHLQDLECAAERALKREKRNLNEFFKRSFRGGGAGVGATTRGWWRPSPAAIASNRRRSGRGVLHNGPLFVELAVFVDRDLFRHMAVNFPRDTEREVTRVVLAMINAVQLLYHDASLGRAVTFVLKRLEVLHAEPAGLTRSHDIDRFLSSFCKWQRLENPALDSDPLHWDHAVLLTGLDLYVQLGGKSPGKLSSQVVGLAPVGGMCSRASSCTVNEGRHFESVYVVAHEIGHNLGMRHDGPMSDNECDPGSFIMSPTLGSGKITWSQCSRKYLENFLETEQASCLWDRSVPEPGLDHAAGGLLPGERFSADQQCMLKYGSGSSHAKTQPLDDVCRDLHCQRDRYTWTSHPALEGTTCGISMWCRSGRCVSKGLSAQQAGFWPERLVAGSWGEWSAFSECASSCLHGSGGLDAGSSGIEVAARRCDKPRPENGGKQCVGSDRRYRACEAAQICSNVPRTTLRDFADEVCGRAKEVDADLLGTGTQRESSDPVEACAVWCYKKRGGAKNRGWTFPDGTACKGLPRQPNNNRVSRRSGALFPSNNKRGLCVSGRCEYFSCAPDATFKEDPEICTLQSNRARIASNSINNLRNETSTWSAWRPLPASGGRCKSNCIAPGRGLRLVSRDCRGPCTDGDSRSIQLCEPEDSQSCVRLKTPFEHASAVCSRYKERVRRLSGIGMQISPSIEDPDRPCRVACQDEAVPHRFYLVNGEEGWFPFGTDCGRGVRSRQAYCVSGKCLEFGSDLTPRLQSHRLIPHGVHQLLSERRRRSVLPANESAVVTSQLDSDTLNYLIDTIEGKTANANKVKLDEPSLDLHNPIHVNNPPMQTDDTAAGYAVASSEDAKSSSAKLVLDWCLILLLAVQLQR